MIKIKRNIDNIRKTRSRMMSYNRSRHKLSTASSELLLIKGHDMDFYQRSSHISSKRDASNNSKEFDISISQKLQKVNQDELKSRNKSLTDRSKHHSASISADSIK